MDDQNLEAYKNNINPPYALQLVALGIMLGDRLGRDKFKCSMFSDLDMCCAVASLKDGKIKSHLNLSKVLGYCGVNWTGHEDGNPVDVIIEHLETDSHFYNYLTWLSSVANDLDPRWPRTKEQKQKIIEKIDGINERVAEWVLKQDGTNEQSKQLLPVDQGRSEPVEKQDVR